MVAEFAYYEDKIIKIVSCYNVNPEFIEIEIPEIHDPKLIMRLGKFINTVSEFGIKVCLDKFGTKTSSLSLLNSFHFDTLKMNQDVLNSLLSKNKVNIIFTKALLSITKELNIKVFEKGTTNPIEIVNEAIVYAKENNHDYIII